METTQLSLWQRISTLDPETLKSKLQAYLATTPNVDLSVFSNILSSRPLKEEEIYYYDRFLVFKERLPSIPTDVLKIIEQYSNRVFDFDTSFRSSKLVIDGSKLIANGGRHGNACGSLAPSLIGPYNQVDFYVAEKSSNDLDFGIITGKHDMTKGIGRTPHSWGYHGFYGCSDHSDHPDYDEGLKVLAPGDIVTLELNRGDFNVYINGIKINKNPLFTDLDKVEGDLYFAVCTFNTHDNIQILDDSNGGRKKRKKN